MKPVIIGSFALKHYGYDGIPQDVDVVVNKEMAAELALDCDRKDNNVLLFSGLDKKEEAQDEPGWDEFVVYYEKSDIW